MKKLSMNMNASALIFLALMLSGCDGGAAEVIALNEQDQAAAEAVLYPRFDLAHAAPREVDAQLQQKLDEVLANLIPEPDGESDQADFSLRVTAEPDADAGCIAGGRLFVSEGMLAWVQNADEMAGVVAMAMQQCPRASQLWRDREGMTLIEFDEQNELMFRYIEYRLNVNASLFNQAVASGCGNQDCLQKVFDQLTTAGYEPQAVSGLYARIQQAWPESIWLDRVSLTVAGSEGSSADVEWTQLVDVYAEQRDSFADLAEARYHMSRGDLHSAYQPMLRLKRSLGRTYATEMMIAELDLHNNHPDDAMRTLQRVEQNYGEIPHADFYWGWAHAIKRNRRPARERLTASIETLPKVVTFYHLGRIYFEIRDEASAVEQFKRAVEAGPHNQYAENAQALIERASS